MLYVIPSSASGAAAAIVSRSLWSAGRCSSGSDRKYAWTFSGFSVVRSSAWCDHGIVARRSATQMTVEDTTMTVAATTRQV